MLKRSTLSVGQNDTFPQAIKVVLPVVNRERRNVALHRFVGLQIFYRLGEQHGRRREKRACADDEIASRACQNASPQGLFDLWRHLPITAPLQQAEAPAIFVSKCILDLFGGGDRIKDKDLR